MKRFIKSIFDIRRGEILLTLLMLVSLYLVLLCYYILKPARDTLFLVEVSSDMLPLVFIITALVTAPIVTLYSRASRSLKLNRLIMLTLAIIIVNLFILRWLILISSAWVYYLFYTWVSIFGVLTTSQFWLLANAVYNSAQAKRVFTLLGLGGIMGAFTGGQVTSFLVKGLDVSTENLLFVCMIPLAIVGLLIAIIWKKKTVSEKELQRVARHREPPGDKLGQITKTIFRSRHLILLVSIVAITMMVASFVDWEFKHVSELAYPEKADLASFFGQFYSWLSMASLILQLFFTYRLIRFLGVGGIIMFLPTGLLLGSVAMFIFPGLIAGIMLKGVDGSIKYSMDKTGRELLFLPIPLEVKKRTKIFIDMFVDRWFRGLAGGLLLLCLHVFLLGIKEISLIVIGFLVIWLVLTVFMRKEYLNSFRKAVEKREIDYSKLTMQIDDRSTVNTLINSLDSSNDRQIGYALEMLRSVKKIDSVERVIPHLKNKSSEIRIEALRVLLEHGDRSQIDLVEKMLTDEDIGVRSEAMHFICSRTEGNSVDKVREYLKSDDRRIVNAALAYLTDYGSPEERELIDEELIKAAIYDTSGEAELSRIQVARILGVLNSPEFSGYIETLLNDDSIEVVKNTIECIGRLKRRKYIPWLIDRLTDRELRTNVRRALADFGTGVLGTLSDYLHDRAVDYNIRKNIPRVMKLIPEQYTVDVLTDNLNKVEPSLKYHVVKALNSLRSTESELRFDHGKVEQVLLNEIKDYYEIYQILYSHRQFDESPDSRLLKKALEEKQYFNLERIFRLLGLVYPPRDIFYAYQGFVSGKKVLQANAIEFLDNLLSRDVKKYILPILDDVPVETVLRKGEEFFRVKMRTREEALERLINGHDNWLRCCAIYNVSANVSENMKKLIYDAQNDPDPLIRETAERVVPRFET
ncbi:MAG: hypothetical protein GWN00_28305 [Aliifodinibius sp.]|nr:hypothetical protein [candidate division Zixibacteria bacterium]NIT59981.1 hypothetical protein [Fodinibius sp.]NIW42223.1 hypothetical protein [candidate division Zixibacteria bacterium]NIY28564.1 hypothetical protein [Fodinibius sp.]